MSEPAYPNADYSHYFGECVDCGTEFGWDVDWRTTERLVERHNREVHGSARVSSTGEKEGEE